MELEELQSRLEHLRHLESRENGPETPQKAYLTMEDSEKNRYIEFLIQQKEERERTIADKDAFIKNLQETLDMLKSMHESDSKKIDDLMASHDQDSLKIDQMLAQINDLTAQLKLKNKQTYADKSQKGISKKGKVDSTTKPKDRDRDEERENFDGTNCEKPSDPSEIPAEETKAPCPEREERPNRQGMNYDTMHASRRILHKSDLSKLPDGAEIIRIYDQKYSVDHLCCMAHARAKFKYAYEQGGDERALSFLEWIGQLYGFEDEYKLQDLPPDEIKRRRNDSRTTDIMIAMSTRLNELLLDENAHLGDMMQKALRYLNKFWKQLFTYRKDGRYDIDNNIAERNIRPLTVERKNSLFFGNHAKAEMSAL